MTLSTLSTRLLGRLAAALFLVLAVVVVVELFGTPESAGRGTFSKYVASLNRKLKFLRLSPRGTLIAALQGGATVACLGAAVFLSQPLLAVLLPAVAFLPSVLLSRRFSLRIAALEEQIEPWLNAIANALKASPSLGEAVAASASLVGAQVVKLTKHHQIIPTSERLIDGRILTR